MDRKTEKISKNADRFSAQEADCTTDGPGWDVGRLLAHRLLLLGWSRGQTRRVVSWAGDDV